MEVGSPLSLPLQNMDNRRASPCPAWKVGAGGGGSKSGPLAGQQAFAAWAIIPGPSRTSSFGRAGP